MKSLKRILSILLIASMSVSLLAGCGQEQGSAPEQGSSAGESGVSFSAEEAYLDPVELEEVVLEDEIVALASAPALSKKFVPVASGKKTKKESKATIDYSNTGDGYVMAQYTASTNKRLKVKVIGPHTEYVYNINAKEWTTFGLSDGNGTYTVKVYENTTGNRYAVVASVEFSAQLKDEFGPFLYSNQYVDYEEAKNTIALAEKLAGKEKDSMKKVQKIYDYVVKNLTYDTNRAATVQSGYLPNLDDVLKQKKGICFDYAALMAGMLRSQGVPCKLVVGYAGDVYHAWVSVWSEKSGWVEKAIFFDGTSWQRMDPTFASSAKSSDSIMKYIGDGSNYHEKFIY